MCLDWNLPFSSFSCFLSWPGKPWKAGHFLSPKVISCSGKWKSQPANFLLGSFMRHICSIFITMTFKDTKVYRTEKKMLWHNSFYAIRLFGLTKGLIHRICLTQKNQFRTHCGRSGYTAGWKLPGPGQGRRRLKERMTPASRHLKFPLGFYKPLLAPSSNILSWSFFFLSSSLFSWYSIAL